MLNDNILHINKLQTNQFIVYVLFDSAAEPKFFVLRYDGILERTEKQGACAAHIANNVAYC